MNYTELVTTLANLLVVPEADTSFVAILPSILRDAEGRIYRELNLVTQRDKDITQSFTSGNRQAAIPATMLVVETMAYTNAGVTTPLELVSLEFINTIWPTRATTGTIQYYAVVNDDTVIVAGTPAGNYNIEYYGVIRPAIMSALNLTTYIGTNYPDLLVAACMVFASGWQRDYGAQSDDPQKAVSWESVYQTRKKSAMEEEAQRRGQGK